MFNGSVLRVALVGDLVGRLHVEEEDERDLIDLFRNYQRFSSVEGSSL